MSYGKACNILGCNIMFDDSHGCGLVLAKTMLSILSPCQDLSLLKGLKNEELHPVSWTICNSI